MVSLDQDDIRHRGHGWLANDFRLVMEFVEGDWKWTKEAFSLNAFSKNSCCHCCRANKKVPGLLYTDVSSDAGWRATRITTEQFLAEAFCFLPLNSGAAGGERCMCKCNVHAHGVACCRAACESARCSDSVPQLGTRRIWGIIKKTASRCLETCHH